MRTLYLPVIALTIALAIMPTTGATQTIFSEDFEYPAIPNYLTIFSGNAMVTGAATWSITQNSVDLYNDPARLEAAAYDGVQAVDLTGSPDAGVMEASIPMTPGVTYELSFWYARNNNIGGAVAAMRVEVIGSSAVLEDSVSHSLAMYPFDTFIQFQKTFVADNSPSLLRFTSLNDGVAGITLDAVSITVVDATPVARSAQYEDVIQNAYPNPFNPNVTISYVTTEPGDVTLSVYDTRGNHVNTLFHGRQDAGAHVAAWTGQYKSGQRAASGVYFVSMTTPRGQSSLRIVLLK